MHQLQRLVWLTGAFSMVLASAARADSLEISGLSSTEAVSAQAFQESQVAISVDERIGQRRVQEPTGGTALEWAQALTEITGVRINNTESGIDLILDATAPLTEPKTSVAGNALVTDIPNAVLALPNGAEVFEQFAPIEGIALVSVANLQEGGVRISITGTNGPPAAAVSRAAGSLRLSIVPGAVGGIAEETDAIQVVVTATRTEEPITEVPRSVTIIEREEIAEQANLSRNLGEILGNLVPGLGPPTFTNRSTEQTLRGRPPLVLIDGVPQTSNGSAGFFPELNFIAPDAIERIEVLSGPSALYGQGATGGVINIITRRPVEEGFAFATETGLRVSLSNFLEGNSFGYLVGLGASGVDEGLDFRVNLSYDTINAFYDAEGDLIPSGNLLLDDTNTLSLYGTLGAQLSDTQRLRFAVDYTQNDQTFESLVDRSILDIPGTQKAQATRDEVSFEGTDEPFIDSLNTTLTYTHDDLLGSQFRGLLYYRQSEYVEREVFDDRGGFFDAIIRGRQDDAAAGTRLQFDTPLTERLSLLWGGDFEYQDNGALRLELFDGAIFDASGGRIARKVGELSSYTPPYTLNSLGLFTQLRWDIAENLIFSGGLRHERIGLSVDDYTPVFDGNFERYDGPPIPGGEVDFNETVFNAGLVYQLTPELDIFTNFAQGFSVPGFAFVIGFPPPGFSVEEGFPGLQPQKVDSYEVGVRGQWDTVQASIAGFYNFSEFGSAFVNRPDGSFEIIRAPQRNYGVEAALDWQPSDRWQLGGTLGYTLGEIDQNDDDNFVGLSSLDVQPLKLTAYLENQTTPGWRNRLQALYVGDRDAGFDAGLDPAPIDSYLVVDFISSIDLWGGTLNVGIQNLFNNQYQAVRQQILAGNDELFNYAQPGRTLSVTYRIEW